MEYTERVFIKNNILTINDEQFSFARKIGEGKSATSYLYENESKKITLKKYIETEQNEIPFEQALDFEILSFERLIEAGINTPELIGFNRESYLMVKEYIDGPVMIDYVAKDKITDEIYHMMFEMQYGLKKYGYHVDYYPANFVLCNNKMYCIDYETHIYNEEWDFINWGIFYWLNTNGMKEFLIKNDPVLINKPGTYKPHEDGFIEERDRLARLFSHMEK